MKKVKSLTFLFVSGLILSSCSDDDDGTPPEPVNETEVITDVSLTFTDASGTSETYTFTDPLYRDDTYTAPVIALESGETYEVETNFYDNSNPEDPELKTTEIIEEKNDHFLEYRFSGVDVNLSRTDDATTTDDNGVQIGLSTQWEVSGSGSGTTSVTLIHQPENKDTSTPNGDHTGGETDAQVVFNVTIQ